MPKTKRSRDSSGAAGCEDVVAIAALPVVANDSNDPCASHYAADAATLNAHDADTKTASDALDNGKGAIATAHEGSDSTPQQPDAAAPTFASPSSSSSRRIGKPTHPVWDYFTHKPEAYKLSNGDTAECAHCHQTVRHHNKVLSVVRHLRKCRAFAVVLDKMGDSEQPEWLHTGTKRGRVSLDRESIRTADKRQAVRVSRKENAAANIKSIVAESPVSESSANESPAAKRVAATKSAAVTERVITGSVVIKRPVAVMPVSKSSGDKTPNSTSAVASASHSVSRAAVSSIARESRELRQPMLLLPPPPQQQLVSPARTSYPVAAHTRTSEITAPTSYTCVVVVSDATRQAVEYFASSTPTLTAGRGAASAVQLVEAVATDAGTEHDATWLAQDLARVMRTLNANSLCGAVTSHNTLVHQQARALLSAQHFPSRFFHGCASEALETLIASVFGADSGSARAADAAPPSLSAFLATFTSDCKRVAQFVSVYEGDGGVLRDEFAALPRAGTGSSSRVLEALFRLLRIRTNAVRDALEAESEAVAGDDVEAVACCAIVESGSFVATLDKALAVLEPIGATMHTFASPGVMLSDVYQAFAVLLPGAFRALSSASPQEKSCLVSACERSFNAMAGAAHGLANLLDPRFLGDGMSREVQERVEDSLFSFPADDGASARMSSDAGDSDSDDLRQETIYTQYTEFRVASLAERSKKSFRFQMLRKGRKSALQYWQSDGTFWPELQQVALKVFSMGVSATRAAAVTSSSSS